MFVRIIKFLQTNEYEIKINKKIKNLGETNYQKKEIKLKRKGDLATLLHEIFHVFYPKKKEGEINHLVERYGIFTLDQLAELAGYMDAYKII